MHTQGFSATQRWLHWIVAVMVLTLLPVGFWMVDRAGANIWDDLTGTLYGAHKAMGFTVLWLVVWRLILRTMNKAPGYPDSVSEPVRRLAKTSQWVTYALLVSIALLGWAGVTAFGALNTLGGTKSWPRRFLGFMAGWLLRYAWSCFCTSPVRSNTCSWIETGCLVTCHLAQAVITNRD